MKNINKSIFIVILAVVALSKQLTGVDIYGVTPNILLALFVASSVFYFYKENPFVLVAPALLVFLFSYFWGVFWVFEVLSIVAIGSLSGFLVEFATDEFFIDLPALTMLATLLFYFIVNLFGVGEMAPFVFIEIFYNIVMAFVFYLIVSSMDTYIESY